MIILYQASYSRVCIGRSSPLCWYVVFIIDFKYLNSYELTIFITSW